MVIESEHNWRKIAIPYKSRQGYMIGQFFKKGGLKRFVSAARNERTDDIDGITGHGELYYHRSDCNKDVKELNAVWGCNVFRCLKVEVKILDEV